MSVDKLLKSAGPLERLFAGSTSAVILDFFMLAVEEGHVYSDSEIARYSGTSLKKARGTISDLQRLGLMEELLLENDRQGKSGKKKVKKYTLNRDSEIIMPLEKLVLTLTDTEIKKRSKVMRKVSADANDDRYTEYGVGEAATELIEKGLVKLDEQMKQD